MTVSCCSDAQLCFGLPLSGMLDRPAYVFFVFLVNLSPEWGYFCLNRCAPFVMQVDEVC